MTYDEVVEEATPDVEEEMTEMTITLATQAAQAETSNSAYVGYGVLSMGAMIAGAAYLYKKRQVKQVVVDKTSLLDQDEEFEQV